MLNTPRHSDEVDPARNFLRETGWASHPIPISWAPPRRSLEKCKLDASSRLNRYIEVLHRLIQKKRRAGGKRAAATLQHATTG